MEGFPRKRAADIIATQILRSSGYISANIAEYEERIKIIDEILRMLNSLIGKKCINLLKGDLIRTSLKSR